VGGFCYWPPTPAHFTHVKFADPPRRKRGEGKQLDRDVTFALPLHRRGEPANCRNRPQLSFANK
jgi:hypothetical protein